MEEQARAALQAVADKHVPVDIDVLNYLAGACAVVLEDAQDRAAAEGELQEAVQAILGEEGISRESIAELCASLAAAKFGSWAPGVAPAAQADGSEDAVELASEGQLICRVENLLLMYGGSSEPLLLHTAFEMRKGHRYGIVGVNGAGKTTLMSSLLNGAVEELPADLKMVHVYGGSVMDSHDPAMTALEFAEQRRLELGLSPKNAQAAASAIRAVGFIEEMQGKAIGQLSGGWRMRLALACAMLTHCDVLMLDEPTSHLDSFAVDWLIAYLNSLSGTSLIISHDPEFLNKVCTDIIHFDEHKLKYHKGNFEAFLADTAMGAEDARAVLETRGRPHLASAGKAIQGHQEDVRLSFPIPDKLEGVHCLGKPILEMKKASFQYTDDGPFILKMVCAKLSMGSRVAVLGANGSGKSTLLELLCGELPLSMYQLVFGEVLRHRNLRLSYIAQHHMFHLEEFLMCTPVQYFQLRFKNGYDEQLQRRLTDPGTEEEQKMRMEMASKLGKYGHAVQDVVGRQKRGREVMYEIAWQGLDDTKQNTWEPLSKLKLMKVHGLARAYDERLSAHAAGIHERPLTDREICKHLECFQMTEEMSTKRMICGFSGGQKARLMLAAAFWTKPHIVAFDEPTNYLDPETVDALAQALNNFRGGVIAVTHCQRFVDKVCTEAWTLADGSISVSKLQGSAAQVLQSDTSQQQQQQQQQKEDAPMDQEVDGAQEAHISAAAAAAAAARLRKH